MLLMKDIEALFTRKVAEYLADGYIFNTKTMSGSQVDLKKGKSFVRISLRYFSDMLQSGISLIVMSSEKEGFADRYGHDSDFENVETKRFYKVSTWKEVFVEDIEEAEQADQKRYDRYKSKNTAEQPKQLAEKANKIVLPCVKRVKGFKSTKLSDIDAVQKVKGHYEASVRGKRVVLFQKEA